MKLNFKQIFSVIFLSITILSAKEFDLFIKNGRVMADCEKQDILTNANLSMLFDTPVELVQTNGFYQAMPGAA